MRGTEATSERSTASGPRTVDWKALALRTLAPPALLLAAALLWHGSLRAIDPHHMDDLGLVSVLPVSFVVALVLLSLSFAITVATCFERRTYCRTLVIVEVVVLVLILYGTPALVEVVPRSATTWQHLGVADYITRHGAVDKTIDAYFNWPGFFIALSFVQHVTGLTSLAGIGAWSPVFFNLIDTLVLFNLFKFGFRDERLAWIAVWVFLCTNWIGQDILSPQAFGYFIYLNILLLVVVALPAAKRRLLFPRVVERMRLAWARLRPVQKVEADSLPRLKPLPRLNPLPRTKEPAFGPSAGEHWAPSRRQQLFLTFTVTLLFTAVAISHQLTPYAIVIVVAAFVVLNVSSVRATPLLMTLIIFTWFTYSAVPFLQQFLHVEANSFGEVRQNVSASVAARVSGAREHELVVYLRLLMTAGLWGAAIVSGVARLRRGYRDTAFLLLGVAPFVLAGLQSYGGEIVLRVYLFALPAAAFFVAALLAPAFDTWPARQIVVAIMAMSLAFLPLFLIARYGNERLDYFTKNEYAAVRALYRLSPPGSHFFVLDGNLPWRWQRYDSDRVFTLHQYVRFNSGQLREAPDTIANTMALTHRPSFLVVTRAQGAFAAYIGGLSRGTVARFKRLIAHSPRFRRIYSNPDALIYRLTPKHPR
jgi:hypothetical protein